MDLTTLPQFTRNAKRFRAILGILAKYGLADRLGSINPEFVKNLFKNEEGVRLADLSHAERIRLALTELGTTFIKFGQMLSTRADLVGPEIAAELSKLQAETPADTAEEVRTLVASELGAPPEEVFAAFDYEPIASASIGQVHRASLPSGEAVVVKVQHYGIEETVNNDLEILVGLAELAEAPESELRLFQPSQVAKEFRRNLLRELDYLREGRNLDLFVRNFQSNGDVRFPAPFKGYSARRVLTMEELVGTRLPDLDKSNSEFDATLLAEIGANTWLDMIFRDGFYHADPHPGNIMIMPGGVVGLLDCGMVGHLDEGSRNDFESILISAVSGDNESITEYVVRIGKCPPDLDREALHAELSDFLAEYTSQSLADFDLSGALTSVTDIIRRFRILLPANVAMLLKVVIMLEGTSRLLDPDFSLAELLKPYHEQAIRRRLSPRRILHGFQGRLHEWDRLVDSFPRDLTDIMESIRQGKLDIHLEHHRLDSSVNRLVYGILVASLFLGSALIWSLEVPPLFRGVSVFGASGCVVAVGLGLRLIRAIHRSGTLVQKK